MLLWMNDLRHRAHLPPVKLDPALSRLAEGHSHAMASADKLFKMPTGNLRRYASRRGGVVQHEVSFLREGLPLPSAQEVVDYMVKGKQNGRRNILSPADTLVGIGVATRPAHLYATAIFTTERS